MECFLVESDFDLSPFAFLAVLSISFHRSLPSQKHCWNSNELCKEIWRMEKKGENVFQLRKPRKSLSWLEKNCFIHFHSFLSSPFPMLLNVGFYLYKIRRKSSGKFHVCCLFFFQTFITTIFTFYSMWMDMRKDIKT